MKQFWNVLTFELGNYVKNKSYMVSTILIGVILALLLFLPRVVDLSGLTGGSQNEQPATAGEQDIPQDSEKTPYILYDQAGIFADEALLSEYFPQVSWKKAADTDEVKQAIENEEAEAGFVVSGDTNFDYYVLNKSMSDNDTKVFSQLLSTKYAMSYCEENDLDYMQVSEAFAPAVEYQEQIIGKDMTANYFYCYAFIIIIFMMIIFYGTMIATSVTTEKSNRSIEVLVTSTSPNSLIFGKVFAGAIAGICQMGFIFGAVLISYQINRELWHGFLDVILAVPTDVLITFAFFGIGGYLFYAFLYGAMGALVSKVEDINKTAGGVQMVIMLVYFVVLIQLSNVDGMIMKVASFLPFSSYSAMFARVAMGSVEAWEIAVSFGILAVSVVLAGLLGAKIYRMGTLRYGNPIKITQAFKTIFQKGQE